MGSSYKERIPYVNRRAESQKILQRFPDKLPIICEKSLSCKNLPDIEREK